MGYSSRAENPLFRVTVRICSSGETIKLCSTLLVRRQESRQAFACWTAVSEPWRGLSCVSPNREVRPSLSTQSFSYSGRRLLISNDFLKEFPGVHLSKPLEIKNSADQTLSYHIKAGKNQNTSVYLHSGRYSEGLIPDGISTLAC